MRRLLCADQTITSSVGFSDLDNWLRNDGFSIDSDKRAAPEFGGSADSADILLRMLRRITKVPSSTRRRRSTQVV
jgi:hypothetical protein